MNRNQFALVVVAATSIACGTALPRFTTTQSTVKLRDGATFVETVKANATTMGCEIEKVDDATSTITLKPCDVLDDNAVKPGFHPDKVMEDGFSRVKASIRVVYIVHLDAASKAATATSTNAQCKFVPSDPSWFTCADTGMIRGYVGEGERSLLTGLDAPAAPDAAAPAK